MSSPTTFQKAAPKFLQLQLEISDTDWAHATLPDIKGHMEKLEAEAATTRNIVHDFEKKTEDHRRKLQALQHNHFKRVWHRTRGDLEHKIHEEEASSLKELELFQVAKAKVEVQTRDAAQARMLYEECHKATLANERAKKELKQLLEQLFDGPTPLYPSDDETKQSLETARQNANKLRAIKTRYGYSISNLQKALQFLQRALHQIEAAYGIKTIQYSRHSDDYSLYSDACDLRAKAATLLSSVHRFDPSIPHLQDIRLHESHSFNIFTSEIYQQMDQARPNLERAIRILQNGILQPLLSNSKTVNEELRKCQAAIRRFEASLWAERTRIMTELLAVEGRVVVEAPLSEDARDELPPEYSEIA
jgi:tetratricopeptide (TPR) repeat protein